MPYTQNTDVSGAPIRKEIRELVFSTVTGGATEDITLHAESMYGAFYNEETLHAAVADNETGQPIAKQANLVFNWIGLSETTDWASVNEMLSTVNRCAYVKMTYLGGQTEVLDSGVTGRAILYMKATQSNDGDGALEYRFEGSRILPNIAKTIT